MAGSLRDVELLPGVAELLLAVLLQLHTLTLALLTQLPHRLVQDAVELLELLRRLAALEVDRRLGCHLVPLLPALLLKLLGVYGFYLV